MEHLYNPDGTRNREFRPYIFSEETTWHTSLYDPYRAVNFGMYDWPIPPPAMTNPQDVSQFQSLLFRSGPEEIPATFRGPIPREKLTENQKKAMLQGSIPPIYRSDFS